MQSKTGGKSAGRVQSVALKLIVDREREIEAFIPENYYEIDAKFPEFEAKLDTFNHKKIEIKTEEEAINIIEKLSKEFNIESIDKQDPPDRSRIRTRRRFSVRRIRRNRALPPGGRRSCSAPSWRKSCLTCRAQVASHRPRSAPFSWTIACRHLRTWSWYILRRTAILRRRYFLRSTFSSSIRSRRNRLCLFLPQLVDNPRDGPCGSRPEACPDRTTDNPQNTGAKGFPREKRGTCFRFVLNLRTVSFRCFGTKARLFEKSSRFSEIFTLFWKPWQPGIYQRHTALLTGCWQVIDNRCYHPAFKEKCGHPSRVRRRTAMPCRNADAASCGCWVGGDAGETAGREPESRRTLSIICIIFPI